MKVVLLFTVVLGVTLGSPIPDVFDSDADYGITQFITGGTATTIGSHPFMVSLRNLNNFHFCGGVILNNRWVLSAAHCTWGRAQNSVFAVVGTSFLNSGGVSHRSSRIVNHPNYNSRNVANDICLVQTATTIVFGTNVAIINLPTAATGAQQVTTIGWGAIRQNGPAPNQLQLLNKNTLTHQQCVSRIGNHAWLNTNKICTMPVTSGSGVCGGDSGGPIFTGRTVIGLVSWGFVPCGGTGRPDVHERVFSHITWIRSVM